MGCLDGRNYQVVGVIFEIAAHDREGGRLTVPKKIALELGSGDDEPIHLRVEARGAVVFEGRVDLASGTEAYPIPGVRPKEWLRVTASRA